MKTTSYRQKQTHKLLLLEAARVDAKEREASKRLS